MNVSDIDKSVECLPEGTTMCAFFEESFQVRDIWQIFPTLIKCWLVAEGFLSPKGVTTACCEYIVPLLLACSYAKADMPHVIASISKCVYMCIKIGLHTCDSCRYIDAHSMCNRTSCLQTSLQQPESSHLLPARSQFALVFFVVVGQHRTTIMPHHNP